MVLQWLAAVNNLLPTDVVPGPQELPERPDKVSTPEHQDLIESIHHSKVLVRKVVHRIPQQGGRQSMPQDCPPAPFLPTQLPPPHNAATESPLIQSIEPITKPRVQHDGWVAAKPIERADPPAAWQRICLWLKRKSRFWTKSAALQQSCHWPDQESRSSCSAASELPLTLSNEPIPKRNIPSERTVLITSMV